MECRNGIIIGPNNLYFCKVKWDTSGTFKIKLMQSNKNTFCKDSNYKNVSVKPKPQVEFSGNLNVCVNTNEVYQFESGEDVDVIWSAKGGAIEGSNKARAAKVRWESIGKGDVTLIVTDKSTGCSDILKKEVTINPLPNPKITGNNKVCAQCTEFYNSNTGDNLNYSWTATNGTIIGTSDSSSVKVLWGEQGTASLKLIQGNTLTRCIDSTIMNIAISEKPGLKITGKFNVCEQTKENYSIASNPEYKYKWEVTGGQIEGVDDQSTASIIWGYPGEGVIKLSISNESKGYKDSASQSVNINEKPSKPVITREDDKLVSSADNGNQWNLNSEIIANANGKEYIPDAEGDYTV